MTNKGLTIDAYKEVQTLIKTNLGEFKTWSIDIISKTKIEFDLRDSQQRNLYKELSNRLNQMSSELVKINTSIKKIEKVISDKKTGSKFEYDKKTVFLLFSGAIFGASLKAIILHPKLGKIFISIISFIL